MDPLSDEKIVDSWQKNAAPWTAAIREQQIESRRLVTNQAIIDSILSYSPQSVLDIGCGEGWLVRALQHHINRLVGVDVVSNLLEQAKRGGGGEFVLASYEMIAKGVIKETFDLMVCNFSLLGETSVELLFEAGHRLLKPGGLFVVQTLHPIVAGAPYSDGWREGSWDGFSADFVDPAPWYFRTLASWVALYRSNGFQIEAIQEPINPKTHQPVSIILTGRIKKV